MALRVAFNDGQKRKPILLIKQKKFFCSPKYFESFFVVLHEHRCVGLKLGNFMNA